MSTTITEAEWRAELARLHAPSSDALPMVAWAKRIGRSREKTSVWIRAGLDAGYMERATIMVTDIAGHTKSMVGFRLIDKPVRRK